MEGSPRERRGGTEGPASPRQDERGRALRRLLGRDGERGRVTKTSLRRWAVVGLAALTGVAGSTTYTNAQPNGDRRAGIQELLDRRAEAVIAGDRAEFMSTVSRDSIEFVQRQRQLFDWMRRVPLASYRLVAKWDRVGDLARPSDVDRYE